MPLHQTALPIEALANAKERYYVFYSSRDASGTMWCPDCRRVEALVEKVFAARDDAVIVWVGNVAEWRNPASPLRSSPWVMKAIPTIIRRNMKAPSDTFVEEARLVDPDINEDSLVAFVNA